MTDRTQARILFLLKSRGALNARDLAAQLGITATGARQHLAALAAEGLIDSDIASAARGRPRRVWRLSDAGHARFTDRHADLTLDLIRSTEAVFGADGLNRLIRHRERQSLAAYRQGIAGATIHDRLSQLAELRSREGYMAAWTREPDGSFLLVENHCPICAAAKACQGFCRSELAIFRAVLGPMVKVERTDHILAGARRCAYRVTPA